MTNRDKKVTSKFKEKDFEKSLLQLEQIVNELETGELSLADCLKKFEEGVKYYKNCKTYLAKVEKRITCLSESLKEEDFD